MLDKMRSLCESILESLPSEPIDGKKILDEMYAEGSQYKQLEYQAFYFEAIIQNILSSLDKEFEEHKFKYNKSVIDTFCRYPIDIKTHDANEFLCLLNDGPTIEKAIENYGCFGVIILTLKYEKDDGTLREYQRKLSKSKSSYKNVSGNHRTIKKSFQVISIDYYVITDVNQLKKFNQGRNSNGKPRTYKYKIDMRKVEPAIHIEK